MPACPDSTPPSDFSVPFLPTPTLEAVERFIRFYEARFGMTLSTSQAQEVLTGLMRFVCLTDQHADTPFITPNYGTTITTPLDSATSIP